MTLVEIIVSLTILFIILTGVLGLVLQSTSMSVQAKEQNVVTNAVSGYVEWLHSLPFDEVDTDGGALDPDSPGFADHHTDEVGGLEVSIAPTVLPGANDFLKSVTVAVTVTRPDGQSRTMSTTVTIRDRSQFMTQSARTPGLEPTIEFTLLTVPQGETVWGTQWQHGDAIIEVKVKATEGRTVDSLTMTVGGNELHGSGSDGVLVAQWSGIGENEVTKWFLWNTAAVDTDAFGNETRRHENGARRVTVTAYDDVNNPASTGREYYIDNTPPSEPGPPTVPSSPSPPNPIITWTPPGQVEKYGYEFELRRQGADQSGVDSPFDEVAPWSGGYWQYDGPSNTYTTETTHFSRYIARVFAKTPRYDLGWGEYRSDYVVGDAFVTRPLLYGTYSIVRNTGGSDKHYTTTSTLRITEPSFPTAAVPVYRWYRSVEGVNNGAFELLSGATGPVITGHTYKQTVQNQNTQYLIIRYRVEVDYSAAGFQPGSGTAVSNTVSTRDITTAGTPYAEGTW